MKKKRTLILLLLTAAIFSACTAGAEPPAESLQPTPPAQSAPAAQTSSAPSTVPSPSPSEPAEAPPSAPVPEPSPEISPEPAPEETAPQSTPEPVPEEPAPEPAPEEPTPEPVPEPSHEPPAEPVLSNGFHEQVPILMYHEVNDLMANSLYLSVEDFISHLDYFAQAGITPISMEQLFNHWFHQAPLPEKPIVLTFDDGYRSMYTTVYPLLKERGWSGTFFCITAGRWSEQFVLEDMIAEMAAGGMEIGSHTVSHVELNSLTGEALRHEIFESKAVLSSITGREITMLCYPAGRYNRETKAVAEEAGYLCAVTTANGIAAKSQGMYDLKRIRVSSGCGVAWLKNALSPLGY